MIYAATLHWNSVLNLLLVYLYFKTLYFYLIFYLKFLPLPLAYTTLPQTSLPSMTDIDGQPLEGQFQSLHSSTGDHWRTEKGKNNRSRKVGMRGCDRTSS